MRLTFPHMGLLSLPVETLLNGLGHEAVLAPPTNKRTFELGPNMHRGRLSPVQD